jgi:hypothetical protein
MIRLQLIYNYYTTPVTFFKGFDSYTTPSQQLHNNPSYEGGSQCVELTKNVRFTTSIQQLYNNPSHEDGSHILGPPPHVRGCCIGVVQESNPVELTFM